MFYKGLLLYNLFPPIIQLSFPFLFGKSLLSLLARARRTLECARISCVFSGDRSATVCFRAVRPAIQEPQLNQLPGRSRGKSKKKKKNQCVNLTCVFFC